MSTTTLIQLGRAEFARICDGNAPSLDSVLTLGQFVMGQLKIEGVPTSALAERTVDTVGGILAVVAEREEGLKSFAANYATEYAPVLRVAISGVEAVAAAVTAAQAPGTAPRWKAVLMAVLGMLRGCMSTRAVAAVIPGAAAAGAAVASVGAVAVAAASVGAVAVAAASVGAVADAVAAADAVAVVVAAAPELVLVDCENVAVAAAAAVAVAAATVVAADPSVEELTHDIRLMVDSKASPASPAPDAPTPPPTPNQDEQSLVE
jgi:hypothetical protein